MPSIEKTVHQYCINFGWVDMSDLGALPKYLAVAEMLARDIHAGRIAAGSRLPGERDMAESLGISVGTLRKSLSELDGRGMLKRVQGSGNYVQKPDQDASIYAFFRLEKPNGGGLPTAKILDIAFVDAPEVLEVASAWRIRRTRALDDVDVALEEVFVTLPKSANLTAESLSDSLYLSYRTSFNLWIIGVEDSVGLAAWPDWGQWDQRQNAGCVERKAWARNGTLVEISTTWFDTTKARFIARMA